MTARDDLVSAIDAELPAEVILRLLDEHDAERRAEVLSEEAAELKAHCLVHNRFAATGFAECPCRVADELLSRVKVASRGE